MISLTTGVPGAGKTLFTIQHVEQQRQKENREVYYHGIKDLTLPWHLLEKPDDWVNCPSGAIIVIDECQTLYRPRGVGAAVPEYVAKLENHRHAGHDLYLITQHPMLVESNVRRLVGRHYHVMRRFGGQSSTVHEWASCKENCDRNRADSLKTTFNYPKEVFNWYKSAEVHTYKRRIPPRVIFAAVVPFLVVGLGYASYSWMSSRYNASKKADSPVKSVSHEKTPHYDSRVPGGKLSLSLDEYLRERTPRIKGLEHTAPMYDDVMKPVVAPMPSACVEMRGNCKCYTHQATIIEMPHSLCVQIVKRGYFDATLPRAVSVSSEPVVQRQPLQSPARNPSTQSGESR